MYRLLTLLLFTASVSAHAQFVEPEPEETSKGNFGIGLGLDYGGVGAKVNILASPNFSPFLGLGYNLQQLGFNVGGTFRIMPDKTTTPTLSAMYGYNGVIIVQGAEHYNKTYFGPTIGGGVEIHKKWSDTFWNIELLIPFRPREFYDDLETIKNDPAIASISEPWPITFSVGYHFKF